MTKDKQGPTALIVGALCGAPVDYAPKSVFDAATTVRDYFWFWNSPAHEERRAWSRIEAAANRIAESHGFLSDSYPVDIQVRHARRVRRAVREINGQVDRKLASPICDSVASALMFLEILGDAIVDEYKGHSGVPAVQ